ncbi:MAG: hypothetical protein JRN67_00190, partial [Nitrososphaerota archaeon]|nr:hypothetical protein [Nitrososphaerota archaeon]
NEFLGLRVFELELTELAVAKTDSRLEALKAEIYSELRSEIKSLELVKDQPVFRAYRDFYWKVGIDPTKTRPAGEALTRRVLNGKEIPTINTLVDAYNLVSLKTSIAIAAFDCSEITKESLKLRKAHSGEEFLGIGMKDPIRMSGAEVVIEDEKNKELIAIYPYRDAEKSKVTEYTRDVLLMMCGVPGIEDNQLERARNLCMQFVTEFCKTRLE